MSKFFVEEIHHDATYYYNGSVKEEAYTETRVRKGRVILCGVLAVILVLTFVLSITRIPTGHTGVVSSFGRIESQTLDEGVHFKAPWKRVIKMDNRIQKESIELSCFSSDIQETNLKYTVNYQINKQNASEIYKSIGKKYFETVVSPAVSETVKIVVARYTAEDLISNRNELAVSIEKELAEKLNEFNVVLVSAAIEDMDFTDAYTSAVEAKQVAAQNKLKAATEAEQKVIEAKANADVAREKAQGEADAIKIKADAEAEANKKLADSLTDRVLENKFYEKWNGELPIVSGDSSAVVIPSDLIPSAE
jgi:regulator of protease activity HflC (stomatin/prohibitin superfamily)